MLIPILIIIIVLLVYYQRNCFCGIQNFDNNYVVNDNNIEQKIKNLSILKQRTKSLIDELKKSKYNKDNAVRKLFRNWSGEIHEKEINIENNVLAYNTNKGEKINICLKNPITDKSINDINTMFFVTMHELAHVMTNDYKHNKEFWDNFRFLIQFAIEKDLYDYVDYNDHPVEFCGNIISSNPYVFSQKK